MMSDEPVSGHHEQDQRQPRVKSWSGDGPWKDVGTLSEASLRDLTDAFHRAVGTDVPELRGDRDSVEELGRRIDRGHASFTYSGQVGRLTGVPIYVDDDVDPHVIEIRDRRNTLQPLDEDTLIALSLSLRALNLKARGADTGQQVIEYRDRRFAITFNPDTQSYEITREIT